MPYRRLPTTDQARIRALQAALAHHTDQATQKEILSDSVFMELKNFLPRFQNAVSYFDLSQKTQTKRAQEYSELVKKARIYVSHFIQVVNMGIARGELKPEVRKFYQLKNEEKAIPNLLTEKSLAEWGKIIIEGDQKRILAGGNPIYNPSIALVKVNYEKFYDAWKNQKVLQANTVRNLKQVTSMRKEANSLVVKIWNEIETYYSGFPDEIKREKGLRHGLVYVFRKSELRKAKIKQEVPEKLPEHYITKRILPEEIEVLHHAGHEVQVHEHKKPSFLQAVLPF
jgi:hypothetical protein